MKRLSITLVALAVMTTACGDPSFVEKITIANPYEYDVLVDVTGDRERWLPLGGVGRNDEVTRLETIDMGERWIFRFRYRHADEVDPVEVSLTRSELASAGWRVTVPGSLAERLRRRREPPSYKG